MPIKIENAELEEVEHLRYLFLNEPKFQFIYSKCHVANNRFAC